MHKTNVINTKLEFLESRKIVGESDLKTLTDLAVKGDKNFFVKFEILYSFYCEKLLQKCPDLTQRDLELCAYLKLNYSTKEIANCTKSSVRAIESRKYRIRKKFNIPKQDDMNVWMMNFENTVKSQKLKQLPNNDFNTKKIELQKFADFSPYPLIISENRENKIINVFLNDIFIDEIGYDLKDIPTIDEWFTNAYPDEKYKNEVIAEWTKKATEKKENEYVKMKAHITRKDNKKNWYEIKSTVINDINIVLLVDIDKEIQFQAELKRINKNNDKILSIIGHDLKTPIANLMSLSSLFKSGDITESEFLEMVEAINEGSTETLGLLDNTLNWAKLNFEEIQTKNEVTNIKNIITPIIEVYKTIINNKKITFNLNLDKKFEANSDPELVTIIIRNIIPNAIKFTPENGIITVKTLKNKISITDNGVGMSDDKIASILRKNYSSENGTENEVGFGIGLQLVMNVCEKLNCKLNINSIVNEGTKISVVF
ncbi:ATP-binding protein [Flavobacterium sp.]|uniref:ATP-binding protein n=1 Tax=Flavobacterium sp. TaxID=239 RepID=UPI0037525192